MPEVERPNEELKSIGYELFIGSLSILSIVNLVLLYALRDDNSLERVLLVMNGILSAIFLADFTFRLLTVPSKSRYFFRQQGWADLLASLPSQQLKILRVFRLIRVYRLLRTYGVGGIARRLLADPAGSALLSLLFLGLMVLEFGSLGMLHIEAHAPGANIVTASDALWYVIETISTVGYGDEYPVTNGGRVLGSLIIVVGVGIFGTFTGYLANLFLAPKKASGTNPAAVAAPAADAADAPGTDPRAKVEQVRAALAQQQAALDEIAALL